MFELSRLRKRTRSLVVGLAAMAMVVGNVASVMALSSSSLELSDSRPGETGVTYTFDSSGFDTVTSLQCISLDFNTQADGGGSVPTGMTTTGASLSSSSLITVGSWTASFGANGSLDITSAGEAPLLASGNIVYSGITNPTTDATFFATLTTFENSDCSTDPVDSVVVAWATKDGVPVSLTVDPNLTFTVAGVASSQTVNGETTTAASTGGSIDFGNAVTPSTSGFSAHDITVTTNASGGAVVYIQHTGDLSNGTDVIPVYGEVNSAPGTAMAAGTEGWGYTTEDNDLATGGGSGDRFTNPAGGFAGFTTSAEPVVDDLGSATRVGHQVNVASDTPAGTYQTTIVYTVVATF